MAVWGIDMTGHFDCALIGKWRIIAADLRPAQHWLWR
jgi:hypothetical protein